MHEKHERFLSIFGLEINFLYGEGGGGGGNAAHDLTLVWFGGSRN